MLTQALLWAAGGSGFTFLMTALGAATVFLFRRTASAGLHRIMLGFAAGVMIAASMWSLLIPAIEQSQAAGGTGWLPAAGGSVLGIAFLAGMDVLLPHLTPELLDRGSGERGAAIRQRRSPTFLLISLLNSFIFRPHCVSPTWVISSLHRAMF